MRISDCSSDVCASDLELKAGPHIAPLADPVAQGGIDGGEGCGSLAYSRRPEVFPDTTGIVGESRCAESSLAPAGTDAPIDQIGGAQCREERGSQCEAGWCRQL